MKFDITDYIKTNNSSTILNSLISLRNILVNDIGPQHLSGPSAWETSGEGWVINFWPEAAKWELYIQDDNLALMFKLKWL
jgi:hypothetical protein